MRFGNGNTEALEQRVAALETSNQELRTALVTIVGILQSASDTKRWMYRFGMGGPVGLEPFTKDHRTGELPGVMPSREPHG